MTMPARVRRGRRANGFVRDWVKRIDPTMKMSEQIFSACGLAHVFHRLMAYEVHTGKIGLCAGIARQPRMVDQPGVIELHFELLVPGREQQLKETFLHELGHLLEHALFGDTTGHSNRWKKMMALLGLPNETRCHSLEYITPSRPSRPRPRNIVYGCVDCNVRFARTRRLSNELSVYWHTKCPEGQRRGQLKLICT